jgi:hypothetical protein
LGLGRASAASEAGDELEVEDLDLDETNTEELKGGFGSGGWYDNAPPLKQHWAAGPGIPDAGPYACRRPRSGWWSHRLPTESESTSADALGLNEREPGRETLATAALTSTRARLRMRLRLVCGGVSGLGGLAH